MSVPLPTVDTIFAKLSIAYGHRFLSIWDGFDLDHVKLDWAHELDGMSDDAVAYGLSNLPAGRPPDVFEFRAICRRRPDKAKQARLPDMGKRVVPQFVREKLTELSQALTDDPQRVKWARRFVGLFGAEGMQLRHEQRKDLVLARRILEVDKAEQELAERKAAAQRLADAAQATQETA